MALKKLCHFVQLSLVIFAIGTQVALAAPSPGSAQGALVDGGELVVSGFGFGDKAQAAPIIFDTQDEVWLNGNMTKPYAGLSHGDSFPTGGNNPWLSGGTGTLKYWNSGGYPRYGGVFSSQNPGDAWIESPNGFPDPASDAVKEVYIRWWFKMNGPTSSAGDGAQSNKFIRVWDSLSNNVGVRVSWTHHHLTYNNGGPSWEAANVSTNQWNLMELYIRTAPNPVIEAWVNGVKKHDASDFSPDSGYQGLQPRLWGMDGSGIADFTGKTIELSDYYADSTRARVELGDASQWSQVSIREPQVPVAWRNDQITLQIHQGRLNSLVGAYLYVIDENGNVNQTGLPLDDVAPPAQMPPPGVQ